MAIAAGWMHAGWVTGRLAGRPLGPVPLAGSDGIRNAWWPRSTRPVLFSRPGWLGRRTKPRSLSELTFGRKHALYIPASAQRARTRAHGGNSPRSWADTERHGYVLELHRGDRRERNRARQASRSREGITGIRCLASGVPQALGGGLPVRESQARRGSASHDREASRTGPGASALEVKADTGGCHFGDGSCSLCFWPRMDTDSHGAA